MKKAYSGCSFLSILTAVALASSCLLSGCGNQEDGTNSGNSGTASTTQLSEDGTNTASAENDASAEGTSQEDAGADGTSADAGADSTGGTADSGSADTTGDAAEAESAEERREQEDADRLSSLTAAIDTSDLPHLDPEEYPKVDGSTATLPLSVTLYALTTGSTMEEAEKAIHHTKTSNAYYGLVDSYEGEYDTDLVIAYEPSDEIVDSLEQKDLTLTRKAIGRDALVFLANEGNPVLSLSGQQLIGIYSGRIRNWSEVGGENKSIDAFQRPQNSGSQTLMEKLVMKGTDMMDAPSYKKPTEMGDLIESVSAYDNSRTALGYSVYYYAHNMYSMPGLRFMQVDGVTPSNETIRSGEYPYVNDFYAVIREDEPEDSPARQLFNWLTEDGGQQLINELGYVSVRKTFSAASTDSTSGDTGSSVWPVTVSYRALDLEDDQLLLMDGAGIADIPEVVILDASLQEQRVIRGTSLPGSSFLLADADTPLVLCDTETGRYGIYSLSDDQWLVLPEYSSINEPQTPDGVWNLWQYAEWDESTGQFDGEDRHFVWRDGTLAELPGGSGSSVVGDYYWSAPEDGTITIRDADGKKAGSVSLTALGLSEGYAYSNYYEAYDADTGDTVLLDELGSPVFSRSMFTDAEIARIVGTTENLNSWTMSVYQISGNGILSGNFYNDTPSWQTYDFLYRLSDGKLLTAGIRCPSVSSVYAEEQSSEDRVYGGNQKMVYSITVKDAPEESYVLDEKGNRLSSKDGTPFTIALNGGLYGYFADDGALVLESADGGEHYEPEKVNSGNLNLTGGPAGEKVARGIYQLYLQNDDTYSAFFRENDRLEGEDVYGWVVGNGYSVLSLDARQTVYETDTGRRVTDLPSDEYLFSAQENLLLTTDGNYYHFRDGSGKELGRIASSLEGDD